MTVMMTRFDSQVPPQVAQDSGSPAVLPPEAPTSKHISTSSIQINLPKPAPHLEQQEPPQYEEEVSVEMDRETKDKVKELERQLKQIQGLIRWVASISVISAYIPGENTQRNSSAQISKNTTGRVAHMLISKCMELLWLNMAITTNFWYSRGV